MCIALFFTRTCNIKVIIVPSALQATIFHTPSASVASVPKSYAFMFNVIRMTVIRGVDQSVWWISLVI